MPTARRAVFRRPGPRPAPAGDDRPDVRQAQPPAARGSAKSASPRELLVGDYRGPSLGERMGLTLSSDGRFVLELVGRTGREAERSGRWQLKGDTVIFSPNPPPTGDRPIAPPPRAVPVRWGTRLFLIPEEQMPAFCEIVRTWSGDPKDRHLNGIYRGAYFKDEGYGPIHQGRPEIPARFQEWYRLGAVTAKVVTIGSDGTVTLDRGSDARLRVGLILVTAEYIGFEVMITAIEPGRARGRVTKQHFGVSLSRLRPGETLTTGNAVAAPTTPVSGTPRVP